MISFPDALYKGNNDIFWFDLSLVIANDNWGVANGTDYGTHDVSFEPRYIAPRRRNTDLAELLDILPLVLDRVIKNKLEHLNGLLHHSLIVTSM